MAKSVLNAEWDKLHISHREVTQAFGVWKDPTTPVTLEFYDTLISLNKLFQQMQVMKTLYIQH